MPEPRWAPLIERLRSEAREPIGFDPGLSDSQVRDVEHRYGVRFPPDLRNFLQTAVPHGSRFPDWHSPDEERIRDWLDLPRHGIVFDVLQGFWLAEWGERPAETEEAVRRVEGLIAAAPKLVPIYAHRMMPTEPHEAGNPVFSVHQADIIVYGRDLEAYFAVEFLGADHAEGSAGSKPIPFWDLDRFQEERWAENRTYRYGGFEENL